MRVVGDVLAKQLVESVFRGLERRHLEPEPAEARLADRDKQGLEGLTSVRQIAQALLDQIPPRQGAKLHPQIIAGRPR